MSVLVVASSVGRPLRGVEMQDDSVAVSRPPFVFWTCLWLSGVAFTMVGVVLDIVRPYPLTPPGRDFANLYTAGKLVLEGRTWEAFDLNTFRLALKDYVGTLTLQNYSYPPHALFLAAPFALIPYGWSFALWSVLGMAFFVWAARPFAPFPAWFAILTPAATMCLWTGHYGLLLGGLWLLYFRNLDARPIRAGLTAAALTFKPHMGLFIGLTALQRPKVFIAAIVGTAALVGLSVAAFGLGGWYDFFGQTVAVQTEILTRQKGDFYFKLMPAAYTAFGRTWEAAAIHAIFAFSAIIMLVRHWRADPFVLATATFIIVPYTFVYDMEVACLGFAIKLWNDWGRLSNGERFSLTAAFSVPSIAIIAPILVPPLLLVGLAVQLDLKFRREWRWWQYALALAVLTLSFYSFATRYQSAGLIGDGMAYATRSK